jgi:hypothetical protein
MEWLWKMWLGPQHKEIHSIVKRTATGFTILMWWCTRKNLLPFKELWNPKTNIRRISHCHDTYSSGFIQLQKLRERSDNQLHTKGYRNDRENFITEKLEGYFTCHNMISSYKEDDVKVQSFSFYGIQTTYRILQNLAVQGTQSLRFTILIFLVMAKSKHK